MIKKPAFTLIELVIYTTLASLLALMIAGSFQSIYQVIKQSKRKSMLMVHQALALDRICNEVMSASMDGGRWDVEGFIFTHQSLTKTHKPVTVQIGWEVIKGRLKRSEGTYDFSARHWVKRAMSTVAAGFTGVAVKLKRSNNPQRVIGATVVYQLADSTSVVQETVMLRNRVLA